MNSNQKKSHVNKNKVFKNNNRVQEGIRKTQN